MYSYIKCTCLLWIIYYTLCVADDAKSLTECAAGKFNVTPLGHSNLLITWDPKTHKDEFTTFHFQYRPDVELTWNSNLENLVFEDGWYRITSPLKENTQYQIKVWDNGPKNSTYWECFIKAKTNPKKISLPAKPDFNASVMNDIKKFWGGQDSVSYQPRARIEWLPCGKKKFCTEDEIAGDDYIVKYKVVNTTQEWFAREKTMPYKYIFGLRPGKEYEVVVTSQYGQFITDSEPQIISIKSFCSPVQSVKIMTLPDSSVLISWKSPAEYQSEIDDKLGYIVYYHVLESGPMIFLNYASNEKPYWEDKYVLEFKNQQGIMYGQSKMSNVNPGTAYTFFIVPRYQRNAFYGSEYQVDYTPQIYEANLTIAKPDFEYKFSKSNDTASCLVKILWLPCGQTYDCKNEKPGSYFIVKYREENGEVQEKKEQRFDRTGHISIANNKKYDFWVESVDQSNQVKSDSKEIQTSNCE